MNKKNFLFFILISIFTIGFFIFRKQFNNKNKIEYSPPISKTNLTIEECKEKEIQNLKNNEYLLAEQLSVVFYTKPSIDLVNKLANKYDLEIKQIYNDPNVIFGVQKENAPLIKCQLENELEIERVVFIESGPVPDGLL